MTTTMETTVPRVAAPHTCPWWIGYLLASPVRRLFENPEKLLRPHVHPGDTVIDLGCAMGFFSIPLARLTGPRGRVVSVDVQERMLSSLRRRVGRAKLQDVVEIRRCEPGALGLDDLAGTADLALAWHVVHEVDDRAAFLKACYGALRPGGRLLLAEPVGHVPSDDFQAELSFAREAGFRVVDVRNRRRTVIAILVK